MRRPFKHHLSKLVVWTQIVALLLMPANPAVADGLTGGIVVDGAATITASGNVTTINQASQNAVINWNTFNVGVGETANFVQPNNNASVLNRVTGGSLSTIAGQVNANGNVFIVNPQGIVFSNGALINTGGITASTLDVANQQFMNGGQLNFSGTSNASVINNGSITANNGDINFFAADVQNNGTMMAPNGLINLGAGHNVTLNQDGTYTVNGANGSVQVLNTGDIASNGTVLTAGAGVSAVNAGVQKATMIVRQNGRVRLGTTGSVIEMAGGSSINATGGSSSVVNMTGPSAEVVDASITANGVGSEINVLTTGVSTVVDSTLNAENVEVSSQGTVVVDNVASTGRLYIDPVDVTLGTITAAEIVADTSAAGLDPGNITVTGDLTATGGNIDLRANNDILVSFRDLTATAGALGDGDINLIADGIASDGAGVIQLRFADLNADGTVKISGNGDLDSPIGVNIIGTTINANVINITGVGGGATGMDLRAVVATAPDAATAIANVAAIVGDGNHGVFIGASDLTTQSGDLNITGLGGIGVNNNDGVHLDSTTVSTMAGNINIVGRGGGIDAEAIQNRGPSWILEDSDGMVNTLFEQGWDATALAAAAGLLGDDNDGVSINDILSQQFNEIGGGNGVSIVSNYIEPANIRDTFNYFIMGQTDDAGNFTPAVFGNFSSLGRDDLGTFGLRHPGARHIQINGVGGIGSHDQTGVDISSTADVSITSESADIHIIGQGFREANSNVGPLGGQLGLLGDSYVQGLIETTKDLSPFTGSDRVANKGVITNGELFTAIATIYGDNNDGVQIAAADSVNIRANANTPSDGETRYVKETGGNIFLTGRGDAGQAMNQGIDIDANAINIVSEIGSIDIDGVGGGPPIGALAGLEITGGFSSSPVIRSDNGRVDALLEIDFTTVDLNAFIAEIWAPSDDNHGISFESRGEILVTSNFEEPPALRRFQDGTYGYGYIQPDTIYTTDDADNKGDLVLVSALTYTSGPVSSLDNTIGLYLLPDENGNLVPVSNQVGFNVNDYTTPDVLPNPLGERVLPVVQQRRIDIRGTSGYGHDNGDGVNFASMTGQAITSKAADINIVGAVGRTFDLDTLVVNSIIENAQDIHPVVGSDRIDNVNGMTVVSTIGDVISGTDLIAAVGAMYGNDNDGVALQDQTDITIRTTLTPTIIWDGNNAAVSSTSDTLRPLMTDGTELVRLLVGGSFVDVPLSNLKNADLSAFNDGLDAVVDGFDGTNPDAGELARQKQRIAKASDTIQLARRDYRSFNSFYNDRAKITIIGTSAGGRSDNDGVELATVLGSVNIEALDGGGGDAGYIDIRGVGGGVPASIDSLRNVIVSDQISRKPFSIFDPADPTGNGRTDQLFEADLVEGDLATLGTQIFGDNNRGVYIDSGASTNITSTFDEPYVAPGEWKYLDWFMDSPGNRATNNDLKFFANAFDDDESDVPLVASRSITIRGTGGVGIGSNVGLDIDAGTSLNITTDSAEVSLVGYGGGIPDEVVRSMIENATEIVTHLDEDGDINDRIRGGDITGSRADDTYISNSDLLQGIDGLLGNDNTGVELTASLSIDIASTETRLHSWNSEVGNISITGLGGSGASSNTGVEFSAGSSNTVQSGVGNIEIAGAGGGASDQYVGDLPGTLRSLVNVFRDDAYNMDLTNGFIIVDGEPSPRPAGNLLVDRLFERDMSDSDLLAFAVASSQYGNNKGVEFVAGTSNLIQSDYVEPINIRDLDGNFLTGGFADDGTGMFVPDASGGDTTHPLARTIKISGIGGHGANFNDGVNFESTAATTIQSSSADIVVEGNGGGIASTMVHSLIENAKDTVFNVPDATTDRTDANNNIGNGFAVAASNSAVIDALTYLYGDNNKGIYIDSGAGIDILANASGPDGNNFNFESRTQKLVGGNITLLGVGGTGQSQNIGIHTLSVANTTVAAGLGNITIGGTGIGLPEGGNFIAVDGFLIDSIFNIQHDGNGRTDRLLEADLSGTDIGSLVTKLIAPGENNSGLFMESQAGINIESGFKEPTALRQFADGSYGFGYFNPNDPTDRGVLVLVDSPTSFNVDDNGTYLVVDKYGDLIPATNRPNFFLNDNGEIGVDVNVPGTPVLQERRVSVSGTGGAGTANSRGIYMAARGAVDINTLAADISLFGIGGGVSNSLVASIVENGRDVTPVAGTDRIDDFSGAGGSVANAITDPVASSVIIDAYQDLFAENNVGIFINTGDDTTIQSTLTPTLIWDGATKITDQSIFPGSMADVLQPLGTDGSEMVDLAAWNLGVMRLDMLPSVDVSGLSAADQEAARAEIAKVSDNLIVAAKRSRSDIRILGAGGQGDSLSRGIHLAAGGNIDIATRNTPDSLQDGGNILIESFGGGIQATGFTNGITDTLVEVDFDAADLPRLAADVYGDNNDGILLDSGGNITIESAFVEPFVPVAPVGGGWGGQVHGTVGGFGTTPGNLVASRNVSVIGRAGAGINENDGIELLAFDSIDINTVSANIYIEAVGNGTTALTGRQIIKNAADSVAGDLGDRISDGATVANSVIIDAISDLYGDNNHGLEINATNAVTIESTDTRVSAPNSNVGRVFILGSAGNGSSGNVGIDVLAGSAIDVRSNVGNIEVLGFGLGFPISVVTDDSASIDSINELPNLLATEVNQLRTGFSSGDVYGDDNYGIRTQSPATTIESGYVEPAIGDPASGATHAYSYRNGDNKANPFFLNYETVAKGTPVVDDSEGFARVNRLFVAFAAGGEGSNGRREGREVTIAGAAGNGRSNNKGIFLAGGTSQILSVDADIDIDGLGGGIPDEVVVALDATHTGYEMPIANLYGADNHGVEIVGPGSGAQSSGKGNIEVNGTGGAGYANNKGILIDGANLWSAEEGDIIMVGTGGGILETFNIDYDFVGGQGLRENNHGIQISGASIVESKFDAQTSTDPYEMPMEALLVLDGQVGNNAGLGNNEVGEIRDITNVFYEHDLGGPITDDVGVLIDGASTVRSADAGIDLFADLDLLVRGASTVTTTEDGDISAVATRHLEVSDGSLINSNGTKANANPTLTTVAWDQSGLEGDEFGDTLGRLKIDAGSGIGARMGAGQLRMYGNRRGSDPQPFDTNSKTPHPTAFVPAAFNNEIDAGATFNGVTWTDMEQNNPGPNDPNLPGVNFGDHNLEFCPWEQEQWDTAFDFANRRAVSDSDRFGLNQAPAAYGFGNPGEFTANLTFFYRGETLHTDALILVAPDLCIALPWSCNLREQLGPVNYEQMIESVFPGPGGSLGYGNGWAGATGGTLGTQNFSAFSGNAFSVTGPQGAMVRFDDLQSLIRFFATAPDGAYSLNRNENTPPVGVNYQHARDDESWLQQLLDAIEGKKSDESLPVPPVPTIPANVIQN